MADFGGIENINEIPFDIRAEVWVAGLMGEGLKPDDFAIIAEGSFDRRFSPDIRKASMFKLPNGKQLLGIYITRDGLYDLLPEALFHSQPARPLKNGTEMAAESKKLKSEEKEIRRFFFPFENEIFLQRVRLEIQEQETLKQISENLFGEIFPEFWGLEPSEDSRYSAKLALLLHLSHKIAGNTRLTAKCLEAILGEKVEAVFSHEFHLQQPGINGYSQDSALLGRFLLGVDFICGAVLNASEATLQFKIGPLQNTAVDAFLEGGEADKFLKCFYRFFVPAEVEVKTTVLADSRDCHFTLGNGAKAPVLGYNSTIN